MPTRWCTLAEVKVVAPVSAGTKDNVRFNYLIDAAMSGDIKQLLGRDLYHDIYKDGDTLSSNNGNYTELMNGVEFTYDNKTYNNPGVKEVLMRFVAARWIRASGLVDTPTGLASMGTQTGRMEAANFREKSRIAKDLETQAMDLWRDVEFYLNSKINKTDEFKYWYYGGPRAKRGQNFLTVDSGASG